MKTLHSIVAAATLLASVPMAMAFDVQVKSIDRIPVKASSELTYHPVFSVDGNSLYVSSETYDGLGIISLADGSYRQLTDHVGAGYRFGQSDDGTQVVVRQNDVENQTMSLYTLNVNDLSERCIEPLMVHTNALNFKRAVVTYAEPIAQSIRTWADPKLASPQAVKAISDATFVTEEDLKMVVYQNGVRSVVDPIADTTGKDVNYCWTSLSPDGKHLLFVAHNLAYTSNLDGSDLVCLGTLHAPVWRDNDTVVGMVCEDDGYFLTSGNIFVAERATGKSIQLTPDTDDIKMFPTVSPDGNRIAYVTDAGELYMITLND